MKSNTKLQDAHIRQTPVRVAILSILAKTQRPISVPELEENESLQKLGSDTVTLYRTLETFHQAGIVNRVEFQEGKFRYELADRMHHHHIICVSCGKIADIENCLDKSIEKHITEKTGFSVQSHSLEFYGLCEECRTA